MLTDEMRKALTEFLGECWHGGREENMKHK
jgi:hypothetical protein